MKLFRSFCSKMNWNDNFLRYNNLCLPSWLCSTSADWSAACLTSFWCQYGGAWQRRISVLNSWDTSGWEMVETVSWPVPNKSENYYTWLIGAVTNQEPRKTMGYCFENNRLYCFPNPRWPPQISANQEVNSRWRWRLPAVKPGNEVPGFRRSLFWAREIAYGTRRLGIGLSDLSDVSNENQSIRM